LATQILLLRAQGRGGRPKGISAPTLALVLDTVRGAAGGITGVDASEQAGISRGTARRYLEYLEKSGTIQLTLRDGSTGRPEHLSSWAGVASSS
jgi:response regulator of citrate/malate metabolism